MGVLDILLNTSRVVYAENFTDSSLNYTNATTLGPQLTTTTAIMGLNFQIIQYLPEYLAAYWLETTYMWILTVIGIIGNTLSICTIVRMSPLSSWSLYVVFLAIMDSLSLVIKLIYQQVTKHDTGIGDAGCRLLRYFGNTSDMTANWLVVFMTAERMIAIRFPLKVAQISTKRTTCVVYGCLLVFFLCLNVVYLYMFYEASNNIKGFYCTPLPEYQSYVEFIFNWVDACFYALVPCALLVLLNSYIICVTGIAMSAKRRMIHNRERNDENQKQQNQITVMLVTVSVIFMILNIPSAVYFTSTGDWIVTTNTDYAVKVLVGRIVLFLSDCNHVVNFFLYFVSGRRFRQMFLKMICCRSE